MVAKKKKTAQGAAVSSQDQHSYSTASLLRHDPRLLVVDDVSVSEDLPHLLLGLVCLVCGEEGHAVGPEVGVEVRGLVETAAAHLAAQIPLAVLTLRLRGGGRRTVGRAMSARGAAVCVGLGVPHAVSDKAVPAERAG